MRARAGRLGGAAPQARPRHGLDRLRRAPASRPRQRPRPRHGRVRHRRAPTPAATSATRRRRSGSRAPRAGDRAAGRRTVAAHRHRLRGRALAQPSVAVRRRVEPVGLRPPVARRLRPLMDARSAVLLEFPQVRARLAEQTSFPPSRRLAEALAARVGPGPRRPRPRRDRPDPRAAQRAPERRDRRRPRHRAGDRAGGARRAPGPGAVPRPSPRRSTRSPASRTSLADERRPLLRDLGARPPPAAGAALHARALLRPGRRAARHRVAAPRRPAGRGARRVRPAAAPARPARQHRRSSAARSRTRSSRCATAATSCPSRPTRAAASRASSTTRRPAARRCSWSRWWPWSSATPGGRRRSPSGPRSSGSSTSCRRSWRPTRSPLRESLSALARFDFWAAKAQLAAEMDGVRAERSTRREVVLLSARHPGPDRPRRPDRRPPRRGLLGARRDRPEHRRQDRHAADARACSA